MFQAKVASALEGLKDGNKCHITTWLYEESVKELKQGNKITSDEDKLQWQSIYPIKKKQ